MTIAIQGKVKTVIQMQLIVQSVDHYYKYLPPTKKKNTFKAMLNLYKGKKNVRRLSTPEPVDHTHQL